MDKLTRKLCFIVFDNILNVLHLQKHQWSSGRIVLCHGTDPGSACASFLRFNIFLT